MRLPLLALAVAAPLASAPSPAPNPAVPDGPDRCRDRITEVRSAAGLPRLDRAPARPDEAYLIAAVDKRVDGCAVMQMHRRIDDLRPLPQPSAWPALIPLR